MREVLRFLLGVPVSIGLKHDEEIMVRANGPWIQDSGRIKAIDILSLLRIVQGFYASTI